jgi:UDP-N-acetylmuramoyl-L-alanyl-D-glutamate--2,6-diaminopimelate ligase
MTALAITNNIGIDIDNIINITKDIYAPKGRVETYKVKNGSAIIDYAHTPDAVEKIINSVKEYAKGKIITVVGCGGDRDRTKRPIMGKIASDNSNYVIFTDDNPRTEDEKIIMNDIIDGVKKDNYEVIYNRKDAIKKALDMINDNDIVLILGKGHEDYQILGREKVHFSDSEQVENYIRNIK